MNDTLTLIRKLKPTSIFELMDRRIFAFDLVGPRAKDHRPYIDSGNCYEWYYALGRHYRPKRILEIGVRFGYSACAMVLGSGICEYYEGLDCETQEPNSLLRAEANLLTARKIKCAFRHCDSQRLESLNTGAPTSRWGNSPESERAPHFDLIHVDGDHSYDGTIHDLELAGPECHVLVIDDYDFLSEVRQAVDHFCHKYGNRINERLYVPSFRGMVILDLRASQ